MPIGDILKIPESLKKAVTETDNLLEGMGKKAEATAKVVDKAFESMANGSGMAGFRSAVTALATDITAIGTAAEQAASKINNIKIGDKGLGSIGSQASGAVSDVTSLTVALDGITKAINGMTGTTLAPLVKQVVDLQSEVAVLQRKLNSTSSGSDTSSKSSSKAVSYDEAMANAANVSSLNDVKNAIKSLKTAREQLLMTDTDYAAKLTNLNNEIARLSALSKQATMSTEQQAAAAEKAAAAQAKQAAAAAAERAAQEYARNTTYGGSMAYADSARSIDERTQAIEYLKKALAGLNSTEADYEAKRSALTAKIEDLTKANKDAAMSDNERAAAAEKAAAAQEKAAAAAEKRARAEYDARAKQYQQQNYAANTTYEGAMSFAENANTINRRAVAVQYLTEARKKLSATDADYTTKLAALNAKIKELNAANNAAVASSKNLASAHRSLLDIGGQLARQFALIFSVSQIQGYIKKVRDVRGEFEMTQRSLQALLGNKYEADAIFNKTVALAVQSPYKIRDLVKYTRQLAAYRIENDKLYDTTKRLADVAAGLGVDMQRLILAYGQVKAAAFLKGTEVRQFTEAGVNIYSELQEYFKEEKGLDYTTGEIVKMISAKKITFEDVEAIFQRMTDKGGMFYNMQLIQAETLQGKIMKFQDSIDVMLNDIGKSVESVYKGFYDTMTALMKHWKAFIPIIVMATTAVAAHAASLASVGTMWKNIRTGVSTYIASIKAATGATATLKATFMGLNASLQWSLIGAALTVVMGIIGSIVQKYADYNNAIKSTNKEYYNQIAALQIIINKYKELKKVQNGEGEEGAQDSTERRRTQLEALIKQMKKMGYEADLIPSLIDEDKLDETFDETAKKYRTFLNRLKQLKVQIANDKSNSFLRDDIEESFEDYTEAVEAFAGTYADIDNAVNVLLGHYDDLTDSQKAMLDEIADGGDGSLEYYKKALYYIAEINNELRNSGGIAANGGYWLTIGAGILHSEEVYKKLYSAHKEARERAMEDYRKTFSEIVQDKGLTSEDKVAQIRFTIDSSDWDDNGKDLLREIVENEYGIKLIMDEDAAVDTTNYIEQYFNDWFAEHDFTIRIRAGELGGDAVDTLMSTSEQLQKEGEKILKKKDFVEGIKEAEVTKEMLSDKGLLGDTSWAELVAKVLGAGADASKMGALPTKELADAYQKDVDAIEANINRVGLSLYDDKNAKKAKAANDPLRERLRLLSEMNKRYEQLIELMSEADAREGTMTAFGDAIKTAGLGQFIGNDFTPDKEGLIEAYTKLLATAGDKKGDVQKEIGELRVEIDQEAWTKSIEEAKGKVEAAFGELDLYKTLLDSGVSVADIEKSFGTLPKSYTDVADIIEQEMGGKAGTKWEDAYKEQKAKLDKQIAENTIREYTEIFKNYGERLSEQLQLDRWYANERKKIEENDKYKSNPELQKRVLDNLTKDYNQKTSENKWSEFKSSDIYLEVFDNVGEQSIGMINTILARLETMKGSLKELSPESVRSITKAMMDLKDELRDRSPFAALGLDFTELSRGKDEIKKAREELAAATAEKNIAQNVVEEKTENKIAAEADLETAMQSGDIEAIITARANLLEAEEEQKAAETSLAAATQKEANAQDNLRVKQQQYNSSLRSMATDIKASISSITSLGNSVKSLGNALGQDWGGLEDAMDLLDGVADFTNTLLNSLADIGVKIGGTIQDTVDAVAAGTTASAASAATSISTLEKASAILAIIAAAIQLATIVVGLFNNDAEIEEQIESLKESVEDLERAFEKLEEAMNNALSTADVVSNYEDAMKNLQAQVVEYERMIELEKSKKDADSSAISDYEDAIEDLYDEMTDLYNEYIEQLGGVSTDDFRSVAESFAEAWLDAFNEVDDTYGALIDNLQDYLNDMLVAQITNAASEKFIQPIIDSLNEMVEDSGDITNLTKEDLDAWMDDSEDLLEAYNDFLEYYFNKLGISPSDGDSSLSALQQGIQTITEETGAALESLLNSMRFYVATEQADVAIIKTTLLGMANSTEEETSSSNPTLVELKAQTQLLTSIDNRLKSVIVSGTTGKGLRTYAY